MISDSFKHVNSWVFDLDNTLYSPEVCLFDQIEKKMTDWISQKLSITKESADIYVVNIGKNMAHRWLV